MIAGLFSKKKKDKANPEKGLETIKNLNLQIDTLEKKLDFYEKQMNTLTAEAKAKLKAKDKNGAKVQENESLISNTFFPSELSLLIIIFNGKSPPVYAA